MTTIVECRSNNLLVLSGELSEEIHVPDPSKGVFLEFNDKTVVKYVFEDTGLWKAAIIRKGSLLLRIDFAIDPNSMNYSDKLEFGSGLEWVIVSQNLQVISKYE